MYEQASKWLLVDFLMVLLNFVLYLSSEFLYVIIKVYCHILKCVCSCCCVTVINGATKTVESKRTVNRNNERIPAVVNFHCTRWLLQCMFMRLVQLRPVWTRLNTEVFTRPAQVQIGSHTNACFWRETSSKVHFKIYLKSQTSGLINGWPIGEVPLFVGLTTFLLYPASSQLDDSPGIYNVPCHIIILKLCIASV